MRDDFLPLDEVEHLAYSEMNDDELEDLARRAHALTVMRFGRTIKLYAPIYLSNSCINSCRYCGFNGTNMIKRVALTAGEIIREADYLVARGHRHILLVAGEDPEVVTVGYLADIARRLRGRVAKLTIETQTFDETSYRVLAEAGIDGVTLYQETYHRPTYEMMHPAGPKADFSARLGGIETAGRAGMRFLGIGALLGLHDWRYETVSLVEHARTLKRHFWQSHVSISFPRIRDCASDFEMPCPVSDGDLVRMIAIIRLALPDADLVLSTRESAYLRDNLLPLGITQMSAGSVTSPGGYTSGISGGEQFHLEDARGPGDIANMLRQKGYDPVWKDWE